MLYLYICRVLQLFAGCLSQRLTGMEQAAKLLDFSQKLDISLLDNIVMCMYCGEGQQVGFVIDNLNCEQA